MRGDDVRNEGLFSYVSCEARVPLDHPLRRILPLVDAALSDLSADFAALYAPIGRPSIAPEKLLRALLLQAFYSVRSERQLMEQLDYNLLFRWFTGLGVDDPVWDVRVFTKNRDRLLAGDIAAKVFQAVPGQPAVRALLSDEHFSVDGTLIEAWASMKTFKPKDGGTTSRRRTRAGATPSATSTASGAPTHHPSSATDPDARLFRKGRGKEAKLCHMGHLLMENRNGLIVDPLVTEACGTAERAAALAMLGRQTGRHRATLGADKGYDTADFVADLRALNVTTHVAQNTTGRRSAIDGRTTRHRATQSASGCASGSRKVSAGSRRRAVCARPAIAASNASAGCSR
jgi:transposase